MRILFALLAVLVLNGCDDAGAARKAREAHRTLVHETRHAFCNCLKTRAYLTECLSSAETGPAAGKITDFELLQARCLDHMPAISRERPDPDHYTHLPD